MNLLQLYINKLVKRLNRLNKKKGRNNNIQIFAKTHHLKFDIIGNNNTIIIGKYSSIKNTLVYIRGNNHKLIIGENCRYEGGELWFEDNDCVLSIGNGTTVESAHIAVTEPFCKIEIGEDCMLANDIIIRSGDSHAIIDEVSKQKINQAKNVLIKNHVWLATHSTILKGVIIENNSIVSSGAIVTKDIPANVIVGGIPAKIIKSGINWTRERF